MKTNRAVLPAAIVLFCLAVLGARADAPTTASGPLIGQLASSLLKLVDAKVLTMKQAETVFNGEKTAVSQWQTTSPAAISPNDTSELGSKIDRLQSDVEAIKHETDDIDDIKRMLQTGNYSKPD